MQKRWKFATKASVLKWVNLLVVCGSFFVVELKFQEYLQELNDTGSFPDESEKIPLCYMKCYLEAIGVMNSEHKVDKEKTVLMFKLENDETIDECSNEICELSFSSLKCLLTNSSVSLAAAAVKDECEKSYFFARCIMQRSLLDHLGEDNDSVK